MSGLQLEVDQGSQAGRGLGFSWQRAWFLDHIFGLWVWPLFLTDEETETESSQG